MADEEDFVDRWAEVPEVPVEDEQTLKKQELMKLLASPQALAIVEPGPKQVKEGVQSGQSAPEAAPKIEPPEKPVIRQVEGPELKSTVPEFDMSKVKIRTLSQGDGQGIPPEEREQLIRRAAISMTESGGPKGNYNERGAVLRKKNGTTDQALGRYQIMRSNLPEWSREALGREVSEEEFMANPKIQDAIFDKKFGDYVSKYGREGAARAWFGGESQVGGSNRSDVHGRLTVNTYGQKFVRDLQAAADFVNGKPTMRKVEPDLPNGLLYPGPIADLGGAPLTRGGIPDTPEAQAMMASLMHSDQPIANRVGTAEASADAAAIASRTGGAKRTDLTRVPISKETPQQGQAPYDWTQDDFTYDVPGMLTKGQQAYRDLVNPSMMSTMLTHGSVPPAPQSPSDKSPFPEQPKSVIQTIWEIAKKVSPGLNLASKAAPYAADFAMNPADTAKGLVSGLQSIPTDTVGGLATFGSAVGGLTTGTEALKGFATDTAHEMEEWRKTYRGNVGLPATPQQMSPAARRAEFIGQNLGPSIVKTGVNLGVAALMDRMGGTFEKLGKAAPIPNLLSTSANAATTFGNPPVPIKTAGGLNMMNDAELSAVAYGGLFGFGAGISASNTHKVVRFAKEPVARYFGSQGLFDPRRDIPGAPGTQAASYPSDIAKGGIVDKWKTLNDIADRQVRYDRGTWVGIDPVAADAVYQRTKYTTGTGAQNHVQNAITQGNMNVADRNFNVPVSLTRLDEFSRENPNFAEYLRVRAIHDDLSANAQARSLPSARQARGHVHPTQHEDHTGYVWDLNNTVAHIIHLEQDPMMRQAYQHYQRNLAETRNFIANGQFNIQNPANLANYAIDRQTLPLFSATQNWRKPLGRILSGETVLRVAEDNMRMAILKQLNYDAERTYIDMSSGYSGNRAFTPRSSAWVANAHNAKSIGAVLKRTEDGVTRYWTADPTVVSMLNAGNIPLGAWGQFGAAAKETFQQSTTGKFAPWFPQTALIRSAEQGLITSPSGVRSAGGRPILPPGPLSIPWGFAASVTPRALNTMAPTVRWFEDALKNSAMGQAVLPNYVGSLARVMEQAYHNSLYKTMKDAGAYTGRQLAEDRAQQRSVTLQRMGQNPNMHGIGGLFDRAADTWQKFLDNPVVKTFDELGRSYNEAANFAWMYKTEKGATDTKRPTINGREMPREEVAMRMRGFTGDPSTRGYIYSKDLQGNQETLRYHGKGQGRAELYGKIGELAHGARIATPWAGVLIQSPAATIKAMRDNPVRANFVFTATAVLPELVAYIWNSVHSTPQFDYNQYNTVGRGDQDSAINLYIANPGERPERGYTIPMPQELILPRMMTKALAHQYMGKSMTNVGQDAWNAMWAFVGHGLIPPMPPMLNALFGAHGMSAPGGWLGETFKRRHNEFVDLGGGESPIELTWRQFMPSIADISIKAYTAGASTETWGDVPKAVAREIGYQSGKRVPVVRDILGWKPAASGGAIVAAEFHKRKHVIDDLLNRHRTWETNAGVVKNKPKSATGGAMQGPFLPKLPPTSGDEMQGLGAGQKKPANPIYNKFMSDMVGTFQKDSPEHGGAGFQSMIKAYQSWSGLIKDISTVNSGNDGLFVKKMNSPKYKKERADLIKNKVDPDDYRQVSDYYNVQRNQVAQGMLNYIQAWEQKIDKNPAIRKVLGDQHFTIDMMDPDDPNPTEGMLKRMIRPFGGGDKLELPRVEIPTKNLPRK